MIFIDFNFKFIYNVFSKIGKKVILVKRNNKAFTLVELLAVIVILGILLILSFPKILEMVNREKEKISEAKLSIMYSATKSYLFDHNNQFPEREGNTYCIEPKKLQDENYVAFEDDEIDTNYVVKVSYFADDEFQLSYVKKSSCTDNGVVNTELAGLSCTIDKTGYSIEKKVTVSFPKSDEFIYQYSLDEGKTWIEIKKFEEDNKAFFNFKSNGSVLAKVLIQNSTASLTCSAYVDQIDPTPIGTIVAYAGSNIPQGYLLADGSSIQRSKYLELYDVIATSYGTPENSKYFYLPNIQGKTIVGSNQSDPSFTFGLSAGEKTHTLTLDELPKHTHIFTGTANQVTGASGAHTHTFNGTTSNKSLTGTLKALSTSSSATNIISASGSMQFSAGSSGTALGGVTYSINNTHNHTYSGTTGNSNTTHTHTVTAKGSNSNVGGGQTHNNLMPYTTLNYMIKYQ